MRIRALVPQNPARAPSAALEVGLALVDEGVALRRDHAALGKIAGIVHFLEIRGTPVPEALGVQTLLQGAVRRAASDDELLAEAEKTFDLLYEAYYEPQKK